MRTLATLVAATSSLLVLIFAGIGHARRPARFVSTVRSHVLIPKYLAAPISIGLIFAEIGVGAIGIAAMTLGAPRSLVSASLAAACALYFAFSTYALALLRWRRTSPCGCSARPSPVSGWIAARAATLCVLAGTAALLANRGPYDQLGSLEAAIVILAGTAFAVLLWEAPDALSDSAMMEAT